MQCRKALTDLGFIQGVKTIPTPKRKKIRQLRVLGTSFYCPDKWKVMHTDGTMTDDVETGFISQKFGEELTDFVLNTKISKLTQRPQFANNISYLDKWPQLIKLNAPRVKYMQEEREDLCTPKAFA